jgi:hypothetical protein
LAGAEQIENFGLLSWRVELTQPMASSRALTKNTAEAERAAAGRPTSSPDRTGMGEDGLIKRIAALIVRGIGPQAYHPFEAYLL